MIIDPNLQMQPNWASHVGSIIGGVPPSKYGWTLDPLLGTRSFYTEYSGSGYADWEAYITRPVMTNTGNLGLRFNLMVNPAVITCAQALEFDTRVGDKDGYNYNFSHQLNYAEGGHLQISNAQGDWVDTGFVPGKLQTPDTWYPYYLKYYFDIVKKTYGFISISIGVQTYVIPSNLQNLPAVKNNWAECAIFQVQQDLVQDGGAYTTTIGAAQFEWE
jgi:hypothetical protein